VHSVEHRPKDRMTHYQATLDGIGARYGRSRLSELFHKQVERWPSDDARQPAPGEASAVASPSSIPSSSNRAPGYPLHRATSACRARQMPKPG